MMSYSRRNPSARYRALLEMYKELHQHGEKFLGLPADETFDGRSVRKEATRIKHLIDLTHARTILDYGSGKGQEYDSRSKMAKGEGEWDSIIDYWDVDEVTCFDPAYAPFSRLPERRFDGVICTDVLEHCPEEDVEWIVQEIFSYADRFVYASVACYPANKRLPNGENAHCTIQPPTWWRDRFMGAAAQRPGLNWEAWLEMKDGASEQLVCLRGGAPRAAN